MYNRCYLSSLTVLKIESTVSCLGTLLFLSCKIRFSREIVVPVLPMPALQWTSNFCYWASGSLCCASINAAPYSITWQNSVCESPTGIYQSGHPQKWIWVIVWFFLSNKTLSCLVIENCVYSNLVHSIWIEGRNFIVSNYLIGKYCTQSLS